MTFYRPKGVRYFFSSTFWTERVRLLFLMKPQNVVKETSRSPKPHPPPFLRSSIALLQNEKHNPFDTAMKYLRITYLNDNKSLAYLATSHPTPFTKSNPLTLPHTNRHERILLPSQRQILIHIFSAILKSFHNRKKKYYFRPSVRPWERELQAACHSYGIGSAGNDAV